jgi:hypothetical protein
MMRRPKKRCRIARHVLQAGLLSGCALFTAASPLITRKFAETYKVAPTTILNVFPLADALCSPSIPGPITFERPACIYWFSQTVGPGRGLESAVAILGRMKTPAQLCLREFVPTDYATHLQHEAIQAGHRHPIKFLPAGHSAKMARIAAARRTAWDPAHRRFCWDVEKHILLDSMRAVIGPPA